MGFTFVAGVTGLSGFSACGAANAGLHRCLQTLRAGTRGTGLHVTELAPGFIDTDMNRGQGSRPCVIPVERRASIMARLIERRVGLRWVPLLPWTIVAVLLKVLPVAWRAPRRRRA